MRGTQRIQEVILLQRGVALSQRAVTPPVGLLMHAQRQDAAGRRA
jgi:hypothetical protein